MGSIDISYLPNCHGFVTGERTQAARKLLTKEQVKLGLRKADYFMLGGGARHKTKRSGGFVLNHHFDKGM